MSRRREQHVQSREPDSLYHSWWSIPEDRGYPVDEPEPGCHAGQRRASWSRAAVVTTCFVALLLASMFV